MKALILALSGVLALAAVAQADGIHVRRELIYPTTFDTNVTTLPAGGAGVADRRVVTITPGGWQTRAVGVSFEPMVLGSTRHIVKRYDLASYLLQLHDGRQFRVRTGTDVTIDGRPYRAVGWHDNMYTLISLDRRTWLRFPKAPDFKYY